MAFIEFKPIGGKKPFQIDILKAIEEESQKEAKTVQREYEITTRTWSNKPSFKIRAFPDGSRVVGTSNKIYGYVDDGTRPHEIRAKRAKTLAFNATGFVAKTVPKRLNPRAGRVASEDPVRPVSVQHPGTEAREFTQLIAKRSQQRFSRNLAKRFKRMKVRA